MLAFNSYPILTDGEIDLILERTFDGIPGTTWSPSYNFKISLHDKRGKIGNISLRIGHTDHLRLYAGHIGYGIDLNHRGHRYAAKACQLVKQVALDHDFSEVWITCNPENFPSRRTCEIIGAEYVETVDLPSNTEMYRLGERQKRRYRWIIKSPQTPSQ
ncbi:MAG: GNAT family N-acetyltransferase [Gemmatimonadetes bacterium]|jgi:predicted acetyltransferase|nr:GNAT family N-acetyltransferase [Gemmatimonadota bacterium]